MPRIELEHICRNEVTFKICIDSVKDGKKLIRQIESTISLYEEDPSAGLMATMMAPTGVNYSINFNC